MTCISDGEQKKGEVEEVGNNFVFGLNGVDVLIHLDDDDPNNDDIGNVKK